MAHEQKSVVPVRQAAGAGGKRKVFKARAKPDVRKDMSVIGVLCAWVVEYQLGISLNLIALLGLVHFFFPRARRRTRKFVEMSYYDSETGLFGRGWDDMYLVFSYIVVLTGLRVAVMDYILKPMARWGGIKSRKGRTRFAEQGWMLIYWSLFWTIGMTIFYNSSYWLNLTELWTNFPTKMLEPRTKWYYLVQFAYYLQQLFVVNVEERRADHWQMFTHHVFTSALLFTSYGYYMTKVGNVILCIMDAADIILPLAKMLNYLRYSMACDTAFGIFLVVWFLTRHVSYFIVCRSIFYGLPVGMPVGCYDSNTGKLVSTDGGNSVLANVLQPFNDPDGLVCFNPAIQYGFLALLMALQVLLLIWFGMVLRVAYSVLTGKNAQDSRSDDEAEDHEEESLEDDEFATEKRLVGDDVELAKNVALDIKGEQAWKNAGGSVPASMAKDRRSASPVTTAGASVSSPSSSRPRRSGRTSAISLPGQKELLGRIGCDKPT